MAGSTTEETPCQATEDAKKMAILLASPSGEDPRRAAGGKARRHPSKDTHHLRIPSPRTHITARITCRTPVDVR